MKDESIFSNLEKFEILKAALWFAFERSEQNSTFVTSSSKYSQSFMKQNKSYFLKFMSGETYSKLQVHWGYFLEDAEVFLYDIIKDKEMLKIYYSIKYK